MQLRAKLLSGLVIPAHPLAVNSQRQLDERRQRAMTRYYLAAGAGGVAVGVHITQFAIRDPNVGLLEPLRTLAAEESRDTVKIAGVYGKSKQALAEAELAAGPGYDAALLSLADLTHDTIPQLLEHARAIASVIPIIGFYLQPAVGGRLLSYEFWRQFVEIENVVAIKIAPFNRYQTLDVVRALAQSGRAQEVALYTGNDDNILSDLLTRFDFGTQPLRIAGGLPGHWAVWTKTAVSHLALAKQHSDPVPGELLTLAQQITDANSAIFDPAHNFRGIFRAFMRYCGVRACSKCAGVSIIKKNFPGQTAELDRVCRAYPHLQDDAFVQEHLDEWLR
jgi:hypothetical protein